MVTATLPSATMDEPARNDDEALLLRWRDAGDREALGELYRRHLAAAWRLARRLTGDEADAEDAVQAAFVDAIRAARSYRPGSDPRAWLMAVVANRARMQVRERQRRRRRESVAPTPTQPEEPGDHEALTREFDRLPERLREAVWLRHGEGLSTGAIAALVGRAERTVRADVAEGLTALRQGLARAGAAALAIEPLLPTTSARAPGSLARRAHEIAAAAKAPAASLVLVATVATMAVLAGGFTAVVSMRAHPAPLPAPPPAADPPLGALDAVLRRELSLNLRHTTLGVLLDAINQALPEGVELPYACEPAALDAGWAGITTPPNATVRELLDLGAKACGCEWREMSGIAVFIAPEAPPAKAGTPGPKPRVISIDENERDAAEQRVAKLRPELLRFATADATQAADLASELGKVSDKDYVRRPKGQRSLLAVFADDAQVQAALRHALGLGQVSWLGRVLQVLPPPDANDLLIARLRDARAPDTIEYDQGGVVWTKDDGGGPGLAEAIAARADAPAIARLIELLGPSEACRGSAARALGLCGAADAVPRLTALLDDSDPAVVSEAAEALGRLHARGVEDRLLKLAAQDDPPVGAIRALGMLGSERAPRLLWPLVRMRPGMSAGRLLGAAGEALCHCPRDAVLAAFPASDDPVFDASVACTVLKQLRAPSTLSWLISQLDRVGGFRTRESAAEAIARIDPATALAELQHRLIAATDADAAKIFADGIGRIGTPEAIAALRHVLDGPELGMVARAAAVRALALTREPSATEAAIAEVARRPALAGSLGAGRTPRERAELERLAVSGEASVRVAALRALTEPRDERESWDGGYGVPGGGSSHCDARAAAILVAALDDEDPVVRAGAVALADRVDQATRMRTALAGLRSPAAALRLTTVRSFCGTNGMGGMDDEVRDEMVKLVRADDAAEVRVAAARALAYEAFSLPEVAAALRDCAAAERDPAVKKTLDAVLTAIASGHFTMAPDGDSDPEPVQPEEPPDKPAQREELLAPSATSPPARTASRSPSA